MLSARVIRELRRCSFRRTTALPVGNAESRVGEGLGTLQPCSQVVRAPPQRCPSTSRHLLSSLAYLPTRGGRLPIVMDHANPPSRERERVMQLTKQCGRGGLVSASALKGQRALQKAVVCTRHRSARFPGRRCSGPATIIDAPNQQGRPAIQREVASQRDVRRKATPTGHLTTLCKRRVGRESPKPSSFT